MAVVIDFSGETWERLPEKDQCDGADYMADVMERYREFVDNINIRWAFDHGTGPCTLCEVPLVQDEMAVEECGFSDPDGLRASVPGTIVCFECLEDIYRHSTPRLRGDVLAPFRFHSVEG